MQPGSGLGTLQGWHPICWALRAGLPWLATEAGSAKPIFMHQRGQTLILQKLSPSCLALPPQSTYHVFPHSSFFVSARYNVKKRQSTRKSFLCLIQQYNPSLFRSTGDAAKLSHVLQDSKWFSKKIKTPATEFRLKGT